MKHKKLRSLLFVAVAMFTLLAGNAATALAATGSKTISSAGSMSITLDKGKTGDSSAVSFTVSGLPANARITQIEINTGTLSSSGTVVVNYLKLAKSGESYVEQIPWNGSGNTKLTANGFKVKLANGTYTISFNATGLGGPIVNGMLTTIGTRTLKNPSLTVHWDDTL